MTLSFTVWGPAVGKKLAASRQGFTYLETKSRKYVAHVTAAVRAAVKDQGWTAPAPDVPVSVSAAIYVAMPASWSKKKQAALRAMPAVSMPDTDNVLKALYDGMMGMKVGPREHEGRVFAADKQVAQVHAERRWCLPEEARVRVIVAVWSEAHIRRLFLTADEVQAGVFRTVSAHAGKLGTQSESKAGKE